MQISVIIILYVFGLLLELGVSFLKWKIISTIPVIVSCIVFLITKEENFYILAFYQFIVALVTIIVERIVKAIRYKKKKSEIDKMQIKDQMWYENED